MNKKLILLAGLFLILFSISFGSGSYARSYPDYYKNNYYNSYSYMSSRNYGMPYTSTRVVHYDVYITELNDVSFSYAMRRPVYYGSWYRNYWSQDYGYYQRPMRYYY